MGDWHSRYFLRSSLAYHVTRCTISAACNQISGELLRKGNRTSDRWNVVQRRSTAEGRPNLVNRDSINGFFALLLFKDPSIFIELSMWHSLAYRLQTQLLRSSSSAPNRSDTFLSWSFPTLSRRTPREDRPRVFNVREDVTCQSRMSNVDNWLQITISFYRVMILSNFWLL